MENMQKERNEKSKLKIFCYKHWNYWHQLTKTTIFT